MQVDEYSKVTTSEGDSYTVAKALPSQSALEYATDDSSAIVGHFRDPNRYIETSSGTYFINTNIAPNATQKISIKFMSLSGALGQNRALYGSRSTTATSALNSRIAFQISQGINVIYRLDFDGQTGTDILSTTRFPINVKHTLVQDKNLTYIDGELVDNNTGSNWTISTFPIYLLTANSAGNLETYTFNYGRFYSFKIEDEGADIIDLYPVFAGEVIEGKIAPSNCFYDFVSKAFFQNSGTGSLAFGRDGWVKSEGVSINISESESLRKTILLGGTSQDSGTPSPTNILPIGSKLYKYYEFDGNEVGSYNTGSHWFAAEGLPEGEFVNNATVANIISSHAVARSRDYGYQLNNFSQPMVAVVANGSSIAIRIPSIVDTSASVAANLQSYRNYLAAQMASGTPVAVFYEVNPSIGLDSTDLYALAKQGGIGDPSPTNYRGITPILNNIKFYGQNGTFDYMTDSGAISRNFGSYIITGTEPTWAGTGFGIGTYVLRVADLPSLPKPSPMPDSVVPNLLCSHFLAGTQNNVSNTNLYITENSGGDIIIRHNAYTALAAFKAWLVAQASAGTPVQIVYQLATPVVEYLTPPDPKKPWDCLRVRGFSGGRLIGGGDLVGWKI